MVAEKQINKSSMGSSPLSERNEFLLSQFHDGECSALSALAARVLLAVSKDAREFLAELREISSQCSQHGDSLSAESVSLWSRVEARINQEEQAAFYLGTRQITQPKDSTFQTWGARHIILGGVSGAALASLVITVAYQPARLVTFSAPSAPQIAQPRMVQPVAIQRSSSGSNRYRIRSARPRTTLEVDWMRANGSLKLIPDQNGSSAIIWVRRRALRTMARQLPSHVGPTPLSISTATPVNNKKGIGVKNKEVTR